MDFGYYVEISWKTDYNFINSFRKVVIIFVKSGGEYMMKEENNHKNKSSLEYIKIRGLFGEEDFTIHFENDINIFIAENGSGKTTILNIIVAILNGDNVKLNKLPFKSFEIGVNGKIEKIDKNELKILAYRDIDDEEILFKLRKTVPRDIYEEILEIYRFTGELDINRIQSIIKNYYSYNRYDMNFKDFINKIKVIRGYNNKLNEIRDRINEDILYFPTYRRIEVDIDYGSKDKIRSRYMNYGINFGMDDVERIISKLTSNLKQDALKDYSAMNGDILNDLLSDKSIKSDKNIKIDREKINIIIGRIGESNIKQVDKLKDFVNNKQGNYKNKQFLYYYLEKLINIYEKQKVIDEKIKRYISVCNKYLVNKKLIYDEVMVEISIEDKKNKKKISFNHLSSGEKQIISLFTKVYLDTDKKTIFLIDEPELSLSIIWQETLIKDIYDSGNISLLLATTHSPYIFKNDYWKFTKELDMFKEEMI